jgi:nitrogen-specific signal transduction histidine kinase
MAVKADALANDRRRRRVDRTNRERQARHAAKTAALVTLAEELKHALSGACERGRSAGLTNHLPEDPAEWIPELVRRLEERKLIACKREDR